MKLKPILQVLLVFTILFSFRPVLVRAEGSKTEKVGGHAFAVTQAELPGFENLSFKERQLLYLFFRAAAAGRDIFYKQRHAEAVSIRNVMEEAVVVAESKKSLIQPALLDYLKMIWINNGQYHSRSGIKFIPRFTFQELQSLFPDRDLTPLKKHIFDPGFEKVLTDHAAGTKDMLLSSFNNLYDRGVTLKDVESLPKKWRNQINVRFAKKGEKVVPEVFSAKGIYASEINKIIYFLEQALPLTEGLQKKSLQELIRFYKTGNEKNFRNASIHWLKSDAKIDSVNGFVESYMDPRQVIGSWEGLVYYTDQDPVLNGISANVQHFENSMPWEDAFKRKGIHTAPVATLIHVAGAVGEAGPVTWSGINLPNYQDIRVEHGSKNLILINMMEARQKILQNEIIREFYAQDYHELMQKYYSRARQLLVALHEVIGHASGTASQKLLEDPRNYIGKNYGAWEEARANLVAMHQIWNPKLVEIGAFTAEEQPKIAQALYLLKLQGFLLNLRNARHENILREAHDRAEQFVFEYLLRHTRGFAVVEKDKKYFVEIRDMRQLQKGVAELLKIVHEAKATGDKTRVDVFMNRYAGSLNAAWKQNIIARGDQMGMPELVAVTFPKMSPRFENGIMTDIVLEKESFREQQLRLKHLSETTEISETIH